MTKEQLQQLIKELQETIDLGYVLLIPKEEAQKFHDQHLAEKNQKIQDHLQKVFKEKGSISFSDLPIVFSTPRINYIILDPMEETRVDQFYQLPETRQLSLKKEWFSYSLEKQVQLIVEIFPKSKEEIMKAYSAMSKINKTLQKKSDLQNYKSE